MPDGRIGRFEVPDGTTPEQAQSMIQEQIGAPSRDPTQVDPNTGKTRAQLEQNLAAQQAESQRMGGELADSTGLGYQVGHKVGLYGRDVAVGAGQGVAFLGDIANIAGQPLAAIGRKMRGEPVMPLSNVVSEADRRFLDDPMNRPQNAGERIGSDIRRGVSGTLMTAGLGGSSAIASRVPGFVKTGNYFAANPVRQAVAAGMGSAASGAVREGGGGPTAQIAAGLAGGLAPAAAWDATKAVGRGVRNLTTQAGSERRAGEVLNRSASNAATARENMAGATQLVKGSEPTAAEVAKDYGISKLQRSINTSESQEFANVKSAQNTARNVALDKISGGATPDATMKKLVDNRERVTKPLRDRAFSQSSSGGTMSGSPVEALKNAKDQASLSKAAQALKLFEVDNPSDEMRTLEAVFLKQSKLLPKGAQGAASLDNAKLISKIDTMLANPDNAGAGTQKVLQGYRKQIDGQTNPRALYAIRKEIGESIKSGFDADSSPVRYAAKQLREMQLAIDDSIAEVAPTWKEYLHKYAQLSKPIDRLETISTARVKGNLSTPDSTTGRQNLSPAQFKNQARNLADEKLTPGQRKVIDSVNADLQRSTAINDPNLRVGGSNTAQDTEAVKAFGDLVKRAASNGTPIVGKFVDFIHKVDDEKIKKLVQAGLINPKQGAKFMQMATAEKARVGTFADRMRPYAIGTAESQAGTR